jgi:PAS domain S-box-containing protein
VKPSLADIVRSWPEAIVGETLDGVVTSWNRAAEELYGYGADEILGQHADRLYPPGHRGDEAAILRRLARDRWLDRYVAERVRSDGATVTVSLRACAVIDDDGSATGIVSLSGDVASGRRTAAPADVAPVAVVGIDADGTVALSNLAAERLFGHVRAELIGAPVTMLMPEATPARQVDAVVARRRDGTEVTVDVSVSGGAPSVGSAEGEDSELLLMAIRGSAERGHTLSAGLSHEMRTPLQAIVGFTGTLLLRMPGPINEEQEHQLQLVQASAKQLLTLINRLGTPGHG